MKHWHYCSCGAAQDACFNESCTVDDLCADCARAKEDAEEGEYWDRKIDELKERKCKSI